MTLLINANALRIPLPDESVHMCVTSPPYWSLRSYSGAQEYIWGGRDDCRHQWGESGSASVGRNDGGRDIGGRGGNYQNDGPHIDDVTTGQYCSLCGAWRGALGLEPTPEQYVANMVAVFREVWRVMRDDGTCWANWGDSYSSGGRTSRATDAKLPNREMDTRPENPPGLKPKDLCGIPWRVAFALQADGWYLRQDIIWAKAISGTIRKGSAMPESVTDRFCKSHEYLFLLTKSRRYFFDSVAVADVLDNSKTYEYNWGHEDKSLQQVRGGEAAGNVQQEQPAERWTDGILQGVSLCDAQGVGQEVQPVRKGQGSGAPVHEIGEGAGNEARLPRVLRDNPRAAGEIQGGCSPTSERSEIQGANQAILSESEREADEGEKGSQVQPDSQGAILKAQSGDQAQAPDQGGGMYPDAGRVDSDQGTIPSSMCLLREEAPASRDGSCSTAEQGGAAYSGERSPILQNVQRQERKPSTATRRDVWLISPVGFPGAHFATYPPALVEPCIRAGTSEHGVCPECGAPWERETERDIINREGWDGPSNPDHSTPSGVHGPSMRGEGRCGDSIVTTLGWRPTCTCPPADPIPAVVLDPFAGSGTTLLVARQLGRHGIGLDLSYPYLVEQARARLELDKLAEWGGGRVAATPNLAGLPMFEG